MEIRPVEAELFHVAWRTDMTKLIVRTRTYKLILCRKIIADCQKSIQNTETVYKFWTDVDFWMLNLVVHKPTARL